MKKSITTNDTITFCYHLEQMIKNCGLFPYEKYDPAKAALLATSAWRMMAVAAKFHWTDDTKENARKAVVTFRDTLLDKNSYYANVMGDFLNDTYMAFTGKACKEV